VLPDLYLYNPVWQEKNEEKEANQEGEAYESSPKEKSHYGQI
jgi:hypothetical protein